MRARSPPCSKKSADSASLDGSWSGGRGRLGQWCVRVRGEMQASRIRYLGSCWDEKRFKGETLLLLFNSSMRNKNISYFDTILLTNRNELDKFDRWIKDDQTLNFYVKCNVFFFSFHVTFFAATIRIFICICFSRYNRYIMKNQYFYYYVIKRWKNIEWFICNKIQYTLHVRDVLHSNLLKKKKERNKTLMRVNLHDKFIDILLQILHVTLHFEYTSYTMLNWILKLVFSCKIRYPIIIHSKEEKYIKSYMNLKDFFLFFYTASFL